MPPEPPAQVNISEYNPNPAAAPATPAATGIFIPSPPETLESSQLPALQKTTAANLKPLPEITLEWTKPAFTLPSPQPVEADFERITTDLTLSSPPSSHPSSAPLEPKYAGLDATFPSPIIPVIAQTTPTGPYKKTVPTQYRRSARTSLPLGYQDVVELTADRQEYDVQRQLVSAEGNVIMRVRGSILDADRAIINLQTRTAIATGNVAFRRGQQILRGNRFEYDFIANTGTVGGASGELYTVTSGTDFTPNLPTDITPGVFLERPLSDRILANQPLENVAEVPGGITTVIGSGEGQTAGQTGQLRRLRYQAEKLDFTPDGGIATNIRITNDPFSPPELELRANTARFRRVNPLIDEIIADNPRLIFDQGFSLPVFPNRLTIDRRERRPALITFGYDEPDRGGLYAEANFTVLSQPGFRFTLTPQYYIQRSISQGFSDPLSIFGLKARLDATLGPRTTLRGSAIFTSLNLDEIDTKLRASLRLRQLVGTHTLTGEYSYRDRLFNGSLGYQTVQQTIGAILTSPVIPLGDTGINLSYQAAAQYINADTDRLDLLEPIRDNNRINLGRFQASAALSRPIRLWRGEALAATPTEGLRYTPTPIVPYLQLVLGVRGVAGYYSNGENQSSLTGTVGIVGQIGNFSRDWLDYTGFNLTYAQIFPTGESPFLFDRVADVRILGAGIVQQIYGPFRVGIQTAINLDTAQQISTDYILEYSRRTYGVILRYNPVRETGSITLRISDFNWTGGPEPFSGIDDVRSVEGGIRRDYD